MVVRFKVLTFILLSIALTLAYQNCAGIVQDSYDVGSGSYSSYNIFDLHPGCISASHATVVPVSTPIPKLSNDDSRPSNMLSGKTSSSSGTGHNAPINLVIDDSIYDADPNNHAVGDRYKELIEEAIYVWETGMNRDIFNIIDRPATVSTSGSLSSDGYNTIYWNKNNSLGQKVRKASGFACTSFTRDGKFVEGDIVINDFHAESNIVDNRLRFFFDCFENCVVPNSPVQMLFNKQLKAFQDNHSDSDVWYRAVHFLTVMAHELGHLLVGNVHTDGSDVKSIMRPVAKSYEVTEKLSQSDINLYNSRKRAIRLLHTNN